MSKRIIDLLHNLLCRKSNFISFSTDQLFKQYFAAKPSHPARHEIPEFIIDY